MPIIKSIKLKGFKSFAAPTEIPFGPNFNMVLGPNGSGKSNIMDALCFVLGKSSAKGMRAEKSSHLIFNGGKKGSAMKSAEVSIIFDNSNKDFKIEDKEVKITRIVKQKGTSDYKINDEKRTRQQILELLAQGRIDPYGHNIILQGDIIRFTDMKPEERREVLEEVAGISIYESRKHKAMNELNRVDERLKEAKLILTEREAHLRELKKERNQALRFKELQSNIKSNKATYLHTQIKEKTEKKEKYNSNINKKNKSIELIDNKINELKEKINKNKEQIESLNKEIEEKGEKEQVNLQKNIEDLKSVVIKDDARLETVKNEIQKISNRKLQLKADLDEIGTKIIHLKQNKEKLIKENEEKAKEEKKLTNKLNKLKHYDVKDLKELKETEDELERKQNKALNLQERKQSFLRNKDKLNLDLERINSLLKLVDEKKISEIQNKFNKSKKDLDSVYSKDIVLDNRLSKFKTDLFAKNQELAKLKVQQYTIKESNFGNEAVKKLLTKEGVYGTIASLGDVNPEYATALEITAGPRANALVVKNDKTAIDCIKYLKENKLGTAIFLPLNKIKYMKKSFKEFKNKKGVVGSALGLIKYDKKYDAAFTYVFGSTLIVEDVNIARRIGVGNARMVTLDGDLFEITGIIIGGYKRKTLGRFLQKDVDNKISSLNKEINLLKENVSEIQRDKKKNETEIQKLKEKKFELEGELIKFEASSGIKNIKNLNENKTKFEEELKRSNLNLENIEKNLKQLSVEIPELKEKKDKLRSININEEQLENLKEQEDKLTKLRELIVKNNTEAKNTDEQVNGIHLVEKDKIAKILKEHDKELEQFEQETKELSNKLKSGKEELNKRENKEKKFYADYKNLFNKRNKLNELINKDESKISSEEFKLKEEEKRINEVNLKKAKVTAELEALEQEYEEFKEVKLRRNVNIENLKSEIYRFEKMMKDLGNVNLRALEVYDGIEKEYKRLLEKHDKLKLEKEDVLKMMYEIEGKKHGTFMKTFKVIAENFKQIFLSISTKGEAILELEDKENPFNAGVDIKVRLIGNKFLDIKSLSGGEKTLAALAFIFAIQELQPAPFYLLDEVDAALDKTNSDLLSKMIGKYAKKAQYVIISHNDQVISEADQIYGVSMQKNGISKIVSLKI